MAPDDTPYEMMEWKSESESVHGVEVIPNGDPKSDLYEFNIAWDVFGLVNDGEGLEGYLDELKRGDIDVPPYYSRFPDDPNARLAEGPGSSEMGVEASVLPAKLVRSAVRTLAGKGRYPADEFILHDCLPYPCVLERDGAGAILIAPRHKDE